MEVKKKVDIEVKSNIDTLLAKVKSLDIAIVKLTNQLNKNASENEKTFVRTLNTMNSQIEALNKQLEAKKKQAEVDKRISDMYGETLKRTERMNAVTNQINKAAGFLKTGDIKGAIGYGIEVNLKKKLAGIEADKQSKLAGVEQTKAARQSEISEAAQSRISEVTEAANKRLSGAQARLGKYQKDLQSASSPADIARLKRNITNNEKIIDKTRNKLADDVQEISTDFTNQMEAANANAAAETAEITAGAEASAGAASAGASAAASAVAVPLLVIKVIADAVKKIAKFYNEMLQQTLGVSMKVKDNFNDVVKVVGEINNLYGGAATYSTSQSLITNASARETQMKYGLSEAQTYALSKTMGMLGMQSDDDLMYMNNEQLQLFRSFMQKYDSWYQEMQSSGALRAVQEFQLDFAMFKEELAMDFMQWFAENKDNLLNAIKTIATIVMKITELVMKIVNFFGGGIAELVPKNNWGSENMSSTMSDYTSYNSTNNSRVYNININQSNNATGVLSSQTAMEDFYKESMQRLAQQIVPELE